MKRLKQISALTMILTIAVLGWSPAPASADEKTPAATVATSGAKTGGTVLGMSPTVAAVVGGVVVVAAGTAVAVGADSDGDSSTENGHGH